MQATKRPQHLSINPKVIWFITHILSPLPAVRNYLNSNENSGPCPLNGVCDLQDQAVRWDARFYNTGCWLVAAAQPSLHKSTSLDCVWVHRTRMHLAAQGAGAISSWDLITLGTGWHTGVAIIACSPKKHHRAQSCCFDTFLFFLCFLLYVRDITSQQTH